MSESFIRNCFRFLPVPLWLIAAGVGVYQFVRLQEAAAVADAARSTLEKVFPYAFLIGAIVCVRLAYREYAKAAAEIKEERRADVDRAKLLPRREVERKPSTLSDELQTKLQDSLRVLQSCGVLVAGDVNFDTIAQDATEVDDFESMDLEDVLRIVHGLSDRFHHPLANVAFFPDSVEMAEDDIFLYVEEFARLTHQENSLRRLRLQGIAGGKVTMATRGEFPPSNAQVEFELHGIEHKLVFTMYSKNAPLGLTDQLADVFASEGRCFAAIDCGAICVAHVSRDAFTVLNEQFPGQFSLVHS
jgi:hypothetical protein